MTLKAFWPQIDLVHRETCCSSSRCVLQRACCNGAHYFGVQLCCFHMIYMFVIYFWSLNLKEHYSVVSDQHAIGLFRMGLQPNVYLL